MSSQRMGIVSSKKLTLQLRGRVSVRNALCDGPASASGSPLTTLCLGVLLAIECSDPSLAFLYPR